MRRTGLATTLIACFATIALVQPVLGSNSSAVFSGAAAFADDNLECVTWPTDCTCDADTGADIVVYSRNGKKVGHKLVVTVELFDGNDVTLVARDDYLSLRCVDSNIPGTVSGELCGIARSMKLKYPDPHYVIWTISRNKKILAERILGPLECQPPRR